MKSLFIAAVCMLLSTFSYAQDTIVFTNGSRVASKILEVNSIEVKYKKLDNMDGPTFVSHKSDVYFIKYPNGTSDTLAKVRTTTAGQTIPSQGPVASQTAPAAPDKLYHAGSRYMYGQRRISENEMYKLVLSKNDPELNSIIRKAKTGKALKNIGFLAIPALAGGVIFTVIEASGLNNPNSSGGPSSVDRDYTPGIALIATGAACLTTSIVFSASHKKNNRKAVKVFNQKF
jgi:hypothetical protein